MSKYLLPLIFLGCAAPVPENSCTFIQNHEQQRVSWGNQIPINFYVDKNYPDDAINALERAFSVWESAVGRQLFRVIGRTEGSPLKDGQSVIYWLDQWEPEKYNEQARTTVYSSWDQIIETDIRFNNKNFKFAFTDNMTYQEVHLESLLIHELGHSLGLGHNDTVKSVMNIQLSNKYIRNVLIEEDKNNIHCEY